MVKLWESKEEPGKTSEEAIAEEQVRDEDGVYFLFDYWDDFQMASNLDLLKLFLPPDAIVIHF